MKNDCLFCKIVNKEVPASILYEDDDLLVILDAFPHTDGHTLVIPKKHYEDIYNVPDEVLIKMLNQGKIITKDLMQKLNKTAASLLFNYGDSQAIKHIHLHLLPNYQKPTHKYSKDEIYNILNKG